jgi:hypothetical protein
MPARYRNYLPGIFNRLLRVLPKRIMQFMKLSPMMQGLDGLLQPNGYQLTDTNGGNVDKNAFQV